MPHVVIQYTPNIDADMDALCKELLAVLIEQKDEHGKQLYPIGGTRVLAYPAQHYAVADSNRDYAFMYINARIAAGRSPAALAESGDAMLAVVKRRFAELFDKQLIGITLQIDVSPGQVYDAKHSNLHPLFNK
jgi:5-carboxymethyl-2-hydroxymuconate isomerase